MNTLRTLARLPRNERALFFRALLVVVVMRVGLSLSSFQRVQKITKPKDQTAPEFADLPVLRFAWAVSAASKRVPGASCLTQSLALHYLLSRAGYNSQIRIGVGKEPNATFCAHAWVEYEGEPLLSTAHEVEQYVGVLVVENKTA
jgi:hypothetical protein